jgi:multidrug efflux pump subunit AcrA (membrane-fusion protein)
VNDIASDARSAPRAVDPAVTAARTIRAGLWLIALAFGGFGTWAVFAPLSGAVIVSGKVTVEAYRKTVQHLEGGIVKEILVRVGDKVRQGQALVVLDSVQASAAVGVLQTQLDAEAAKQQRLQAELGRADKVAFSEDLRRRRSTSAEIDAMLKAEENLFAARQRLLRNQVAILRAQIGAIQEEIAGLEE